MSATGDGDGDGDADPDADADPEDTDDLDDLRERVDELTRLVNALADSQEDLAQMVGAVATGDAPTDDDDDPEGEGAGASMFQ